MCKFHTFFYYTLTYVSALTIYILWENIYIYIYIYIKHEQHFTFQNTSEISETTNTLIPLKGPK